MAAGDGDVGEANAAGERLDEDLVGGGGLEVHGGEGEGAVCFVDDDGFVGLGEGSYVCFSWRLAT